MDEAQALADRVAVMRPGEIIAVGRPDELGGRDLRPAEIRFRLPGGWSLGDLPELAATERSMAGDVHHLPLISAVSDRAPALQHALTIAGAATFVGAYIALVMTWRGGGATGGRGC